VPAPGPWFLVAPARQKMACVVLLRALCVVLFIRAPLGGVVVDTEFRMLTAPMD
jgi:hypothetical protein